MSSWYLRTKKGSNTANFISLLEAIRLYKDLIFTKRIKKDGSAAHRLDMLQAKLDEYIHWKKKPLHVRKAVANPLEN